jgi:hypothetical protein
MMIERTLFKIFEAGLDWFKEDPRRFERWLLAEQLIEEAEAENARIYFAGNPDADPPIPPKAPTLVHGYARTGGPFPCIALTLGSEDIANDYLGRDMDMLDSDGENYIDPETGDIVDPHGRRFRYNFNFLIHAQHPDVCVWYYHLAKYILMSAHPELERRDVEDMVLSGRDMAPDPSYLPSDVFTRMLTVTCEGDETWEQPIEPSFGARITGIFAEQTDELTAAGETAKVQVYGTEKS